MKRMEARVLPELPNYKQVRIRIGDTRLELSAWDDGTWTLYEIYPEPGMQATMMNDVLASGRVETER